MKLLRSGPLLIICLLVGFIALYFLFLRQTSVAAAPQKSASPLLSLVQAQLKSLPLMLKTQVHVVSLNQVDIQSQITGTVKTVDFHEGDFVRQGQLLFTLDDNTQQAALQRAIAAQVQAHSLLNKAQRDLARGRGLKAQNYISASDWDQLQSAQQQYSAQYLGPGRPNAHIMENIGGTWLNGSVEGTLEQKG